MNWSSISSSITAAGDYLLGWLLLLPRDVAIVAVALLTSLVLTLVRKWCTNQELLGRCAADLRRLKQLIRQAKTERGDPLARRANLQRLKSTVSLIKLKQLGAEGRVLLASLLPLVVLATWGMERLDYHPPRPGQELTVRAYYPLTSVDKLTHLVPPPGFELKSPASPVQPVRVDDDGGVNGIAQWVLTAKEPVAASQLFIRHQDQSVAHAVRVDGRAYEPPVQNHDEALIPATEIHLEQAKFLGRLPGLPALGLAPWVIAYLLLAVLLVYPLRKLLRVW